MIYPRLPEIKMSMNASNRWNWLKDLETFQRSMDSLLSRSPTRRSDSPVELKTQTQWQPLMEFSETDEEYLITAELPGLNMDDVQVSAESGTLTIVGQTTSDKGTAEKRPGLVLIGSSFGRTFLLPDDVSPANVNAEITDGVLMVSLIKRKKPKPQPVEVS